MKIADKYEKYFIAKQKRDEFDKLYRKLRNFAGRQFQNHYFRGEAGGIPPSGDDYEDFVIRALMECSPINSREDIVDTEIITKYHVENLGLNWEEVSTIFIHRQWAKAFRKNQILLNEDWEDHLKDIKDEFKHKQSWDFAKGEFKKYSPPEVLIRAIKTRGHIVIPKAKTPVESLNNLLCFRNLYKFMVKQPDRIKEAVHRLKQGKEIKSFKIRRLNRILIEANYPKETPKSKNDFLKLYSILKRANQIFITELYNFIRDEISGESRLRINNLIRNESYYDDRGYYYNPFTVTPDNRVIIDEEMIENGKNRVIEQIVRGFMKTITDPELLKCVKAIASDQVRLKELIGKFIDDSGALMKELIRNNWIYDASGQPTERVKKINRPCKLNLDYTFKDKREKKYLFGILKMNHCCDKPQFAALYLNIPKEQYYQLVRKLKIKFVEFLNEHKKRENADLLKEMGIFQEPNFKKTHKRVD